MVSRCPLKEEHKDHEPQVLRLSVQGFDFRVASFFYRRCGSVLRCGSVPLVVMPEALQNRSVKGLQEGGGLPPPNPLLFRN